MIFKSTLINVMLVSPFLTSFVSQANAEPMLPPLIFSNTYITAGENAKLHGDIKAITYFVAGANVQLGKAAIGDELAISGDIQTGTAVTTGAGSIVTGNIRASTAITLGAATILGTVSDDDGGACAGTALNLGAAVTYNAGFACDASSPAIMTYNRTDLVNAKGSYSNITNLGGKPNVLASTISVHTTLDPEGSEYLADVLDDNGLPTYVYNATSLTTGAGIDIILKGDVNWVFNIDSMLSLGAGSEIILDGDTGSVTWNVGGYTSLGAHAKLVGIVLSNGYVSTGASSIVTGAPSTSGDYCGGLFSANSYVTVGALGTVGGCNNTGGTPVNPDVTVNLKISVDNNDEVFINGKYLGKSNVWENVTSYSVELNEDKIVIAVKGTDNELWAALIAEIQINGEIYVSNDTWKVSNEHQAGWYETDFIDSDWVDATEYGDYGVSPWGNLKFFDNASAKWIWTEGVTRKDSNDQNDDIVYFRYTISIN